MTTNDFICDNFTVYTEIAERIDAEVPRLELVSTETVSSLCVEFIAKYPQHPKAMIINTVIKAANEHNGEAYQRNARSAVGETTGTLVL